jgi:hypothetical protein
MKVLSAAILIASVPLTPVLAEEVLHCADTNYAGFKWDKKGEASPLVTFPLQRFTIKVGPTQSYPFISDKERLIWPAPGSEDTELGVLMEPEVGHGETEVYAGVQA